MTIGFSCAEKKERRGKSLKVLSNQKEKSFRSEPLGVSSSHAADKKMVKTSVLKRGEKKKERESKQLRLCIISPASRNS